MPVSITEPSLRPIWESGTVTVAVEIPISVTVDTHGLLMLIGK